MLLEDPSPAAVSCYLSAYYTVESSSIYEIPSCGKVNFVVVNQALQPSCFDIQIKLQVGSQKNNTVHNENTQVLHVGTITDSKGTARKEKRINKSLARIGIFP